MGEGTKRKDKGREKRNIKDTRSDDLVAVPMNVIVLMGQEVKSSGRSLSTYRRTCLSVLKSEDLA
jgi:hypothetical protein